MFNQYNWQHGGCSHPIWNVLFWVFDRIMPYIQDSHGEKSGLFSPLDSRKQGVVGKNSDLICSKHVVRSTNSTGHRPPPVFVKMYQKTFAHIPIVHGCFRAATAEFSSCNETVRPTEPVHWPAPKKAFAKPSYDKVIIGQWCSRITRSADGRPGAIPDLLNPVPGICSQGLCWWFGRTSRVRP